MTIDDDCLEHKIIHLHSFPFLLECSTVVKKRTYAYVPEGGLEVTKVSGTPMFCKDLQLNVPVLLYFMLIDDISSPLRSRRLSA